jgi:hypothetical protein
MVVAGTMRYTIDGVESRDLGPGSYVDIAPEAPHFAHCMPGEACEVYLEQDGAMDVSIAKTPRLPRRQRLGEDLRY